MRAPALRLGLAMVVLAAAVGCGRGTDGDSSTTTAPQSSSTTVPDPQAPDVGTVLGVLNRAVLVDARPAQAGGGIKAGGRVSTDAAGVATFSMKRKLEDCQMFQRSEVVLQPQGGVLLEVVKGRVSCRTDTARDDVDLEVAGVPLSVRDPVFSVEVTGGNVRVEVAKGFVDVTPGQPRAVLLGPNSRTTVAKTVSATPPRVARFAPGDLEGQERQAVDRMVAALPQPSFAIPSTRSPGLDRIRATKSIRVGVDGAAGDDEDELLGGFLDQFLSDHLGRRWSAAPDFTTGLDPVKAVARLGTDFEVLVAPEAKVKAVTALRAAPAAIPLVREGKVLWYLLVAGSDRGLEDALTDFLRASLEDGVYATLYREAYNGTPDYGPLRPVIFSE